MFVHLVRVRAQPILVVDCDQLAHYCYAIDSAHIFIYDLVLQHLVFIYDTRTTCMVVSLCLLLVQLYQVAG